MRVDHSRFGSTARLIARKGASLLVMAGLVPAIPTGRALRIGITGTSPVMTHVEESLLEVHDSL
jgi:hypothetical protein